MTRSKDLVLQELAQENTRLADLERKCDEARGKMESLRVELAAASVATLDSPQLQSTAGSTTPRTPADKVRLFRSLFRGREDIYPVRFVSKKTARAGYAPACSNKWKPGQCLLKTGGKCSDCTNQAFIPVGDQVVLDHLQGHHVAGTYPLLKDETCWFPALGREGPQTVLSRRVSSGRNVTMTCRPLSGLGWMGSAALEHCSVFVWHMSKDCPPKVIIDGQFSLAGFTQSPTPDCRWSPSYFRITKTLAVDQRVFEGGAYRRRCCPEVH
jgi:hypothetical protein